MFTDNYNYLCTNIYNSPEVRQKERSQYGTLPEHRIAPSLLHCQSSPASGNRAISLVAAACARQKSHNV